VCVSMLIIATASVLYVVLFSFIAFMPIYIVVTVCYCCSHI
jgi:hypothetical protein